MEAAAAAAAAACVLVRVTGADAHGRAAAAAAFHAAPERGITALSVSGAVLRVAPDGAARVVCPLAPLAAFSATPSSSSPPYDRGGCAAAPVFAFQRGVTCEAQLAGGPAWRSARVVAVVDLLATSAPLQAALAPLLAAGAWSLGWPPATSATSASAAAEPQLAAAPATARPPGAALWLAVLEVHPDGAHESVTASHRVVVAPSWASARHLRRGAPLALAGAPFGALAPAHFAACVAAACIANALPPNALDAAPAAAAAAAFLLDARTLPGAEGGPVACAATGALVGLLLPPLRPTAPASPEVPLMVTWDVVAAALGEPRPQAAPPPAPLLASSCAVVPPAAVAAACRAVALVSVRGGATWGSAVCVGASRGLYLTAAHLLHPAAPGAAGGTGAAMTAAAANRNDALPQLPRGAVPDAMLRCADGVWRRAAAAWVCRGALDLALLALQEPLPREGLTHLSTHDAESADANAGAGADANESYDTAALAPGAPCAVLGHAQFAPAAALPPAVARGVVSRCVAPHLAAAPCMLLTSAAVHAGASGGAVVGRNGQLLGLVTSNARAAGAAAPLPHLNFSVAAPALSRLCAAARAVPRGAALVPGATGAPAMLLAACAALDEADTALSALWALQPLPAPPPGPRLASFLQRFRDGKHDDDAHGPPQRSRL